MLIALTLTILGMLTIFQMIGGAIALYNASAGVTASGIVNSTVTDFTVNNNTYIFSFDLTTGMIAILITISLLAVIGLSIFGSGLNDTSSHLLITITAYVGVWGLMTFLTFNLFLEIPIFGIFIYLTLTVLYSVGVIQSVTGSSSL